MLDHDILVKRACKLTQLPRTATRLAALMADPNADSKSILEAIAVDPTLTAQVLRSANAAPLAPRWGFSTIKEAVGRLGIGPTLCIAIGGSVGSVMDRPIAGYSMGPGALRRHGEIAVIAVEAAMPLSPLKWPIACFTAAFLHDIGKLIVGSEITEERRLLLEQAQTLNPLEAHEAEMEVLGVDHAEVGAVIAQHWKLPEIVVRGIIEHHNPRSNSLIGSIVRFADAVAHRSDDASTSYAIDPAKLASVLQRLEIPDQSFEAICATVRSRAKRLTPPNESLAPAPTWGFSHGYQNLS